MKAILLLLFIDGTEKQIEVCEIKYIIYKNYCRIPVSILISETTSDLSFDPKAILDPLPTTHSTKLQSASITAPTHSTLFWMVQLQNKTKQLRGENANVASNLTYLAPI